jgi:hypothetical protein
MTANPVGGVTLLPRNNPGWALVVSNLSRAGMAISGGYASLLHNGVLIGVGQCTQRTLPTAATVGDVAPEWEHWPFSIGPVQGSAWIFLDFRLRKIRICATSFDWADLNPRYPGLEVGKENGSVLAAAITRGRIFCLNRL